MAEQPCGRIGLIAEPLGRIPRPIGRGHCLEGMTGGRQHGLNTHHWTNRVVAAIARWIKRAGLE
jgi:hypothetical protein